VALSLLVEVAYEQDEELRQHLPQLLHLCLISADSPNPLVRRDSQQLLVYLLFSLSLKHLESGGAPPSPECQGVAEVVSQLQGRLGQQLWPREQPSLAQPLVPSAAAVAVFVQTGACGGGASALGWVPGWMAGWLAAAFAASHVCCSPSRPSSGLHALLSHIFS
jgi:hypothetical protein